MLHLESSIFCDVGLCEQQLLFCDVLVEMLLVLKLELADLLLQFSDAMLLMVKALLGLMLFCGLFLPQVRRLSGMLLLHWQGSSRQSTCQCCAAGLP